MDVMKHRRSLGNLASFCYFIAGYSLEGVFVLLTFLIGYKMKIGELFKLAFSASPYINVLCIYILISVVIFPISFIGHMAVETRLYYMGGFVDYPKAMAVVADIMYKLQTLCWKPYKGIDIQWLFTLSSQSSHDRRVNVRRWIPKFLETVLWWGIIAGIIYSIKTSDVNYITLALSKTQNKEKAIVLGASLAITIVASIIFGIYSII